MMFYSNVALLKRYGNMLFIFIVEDYYTDVTQIWLAILQSKGPTTFYIHLALSWFIWRSINSSCFQGLSKSVYQIIIEWHTFVESSNLPALGKLSIRCLQLTHNAFDIALPATCTDLLIQVDGVFKKQQVLV